MTSICHGVWNEPNLDQYLQSTDPRVYRWLAITACAAIRAANPKTQVIGQALLYQAFITANSSSAR